MMDVMPILQARVAPVAASGPVTGLLHVGARGNRPHAEDDGVRPGQTYLGKC